MCISILSKAKVQLPLDVSHAAVPKVTVYLNVKLKEAHDDSTIAQDVQCASGSATFIHVQDDSWRRLLHHAPACCQSMHHGNVSIMAGNVRIDESIGCLCCHFMSKAAGADATTVHGSAGAMKTSWGSRMPTLHAGCCWLCFPTGHGCGWVAQEELIDSSNDGG